MNNSIKALAQLVAPASLVPSTRASNDSELARTWLQRFKSPHTRRAYLFDIELYGKEVGLPIAELKVEDLLNYRDKLGKGTEGNGLNYSIPRQRRALTALKSLLTFAKSTGYLPFNVGTVVELPDLDTNLSQRISTEGEILTILALTKNPFEKALLALLYKTGLRNSELCNAKWKDLALDGERGFLKVLGKGGKLRTVLIDTDILPLVLALRGGSSEEKTIFSTRNGKPLSPVQVWRVCKRRAVEAGVKLSVDGKTEGTRFSPHFFRHAHASHALDNGASPALVMENLGHKSLDTLSKYAHARPKDGSGRYLKVA